MFAAAFTVVLFLCLARNFHAAGSQLAVPPNVTMVTLNTNYTLRWDWDPSWSRDVTFTVKYIADYKVTKQAKHPEKVQWNVMCTNLSRQSCDLSEANLLYLGKFLVCVRAEANGSHSEWKTLMFHPDKHAKVGPPSRVTLSNAGSAVDIHIDDPVTSANTSMRTAIPNMYYNILYWEGPLFAQSSLVKNVSSKANLVTLSDLKSGTRYCVAVQTRNNYFLKESSFTSPLCIQTEGVVAWWAIALCFLGSMMVCFLLVLFSYKTYNFVKATFFPASQLPNHFREYLCDSPGSDMPRLLTSEVEQLCDKVVICPRPFPPDEGVAAPPSCLEAESSHQGGSRDSGVYSSDSGSSVSQPSSQQTSRGSDVFWTDLCNLDKLKMDVRSAGLPVGDEGISDVCI